jgi:tripartite-type tricarboxylate transporter receptor subunit TctC
MSCFSLPSAFRFLTIIGMSLISVSIYAQSYPSRPITFVVPYGPGGSTDPVARQYAMQLQKALGVEVNIENKPGGSGTIGTGMVVRSKPDGYTLGLATNSILGYQPLVNANLVFKTPDQYQPIVKLGEMPVILVVRADAPWKTFAEFVQHVKDNPGKVRASVSGLRTVPDLLAQEFNMVAGTKLRTVPFTGGSGEALVALLGNRVEATLFTGAVGIPSHVQAGKVRVLATFKKGVYDPVPESQSTVDAGYNTTMTASFYVIAPKGLPPEVLDKLTKTSMEIVQSAEFIRFAKEGYALDPKGPAALREEIVRDTKTVSELIKALDQK